MDEEYDYEDEDDAALPALGAQEAQYSAPAASSGAPTFIPYHPAMNAQQRRMVDMMNFRRMNEYRQDMYTRRSEANQRAVLQRQEAGRNFRAQQSNILEERRQGREDRRTAAQIEAENRREAMRIAAENRREAMRIEAERRRDPRFARQMELEGINADLARGQTASRARLLEQVQDQQPTGYAGALPLEMQGEGGFQNPAATMQMPAEAAQPADVESALGLTFGREFAASPGQKAQAIEARKTSEGEVDTMGRVADARRLDVTAEYSPKRTAFKEDYEARIAPYSKALDTLLKEGEEEVKSRRVDAALLPKLNDPKNRNKKERFLGLVDRIAGMNDVSPEILTRSLFAASQLVNEDTNAPVVLPDGRVQIGTERLVMDRDMFRSLALIRAERIKEMREATTKQQTVENPKREAARALRRQLDDDYARRILE